METLEDLLVNVYGGALVGVMLTSIVFGIITVQTYMYYQRFPNDGILTKLMVAFLWSIQAFEVGCTTYALYWYFIKHYGNEFLLVDAIWEGTTYQTVSTIASMTTQSFFAWRVYTLSHSVLLGVFMETLVLAQCSLGAITAAKAYILGNFAEISVKEYYFVLAWLACEAISDTAIATSMVLLLRRQRTGFSRYVRRCELSLLLWRLILLG
jgi:predicted neutral ceramidase superfamily lipid hydrolase